VAWLERTLQFDIGSSYRTPADVQVGFESVLASDRSYVTASKTLDEWVSAIGGRIDAERQPARDAAAAGLAPAVTAVDEAVPQALDVIPPARRRSPMAVMASTIVLLLVMVGWLSTRDTGVPRAGEGELNVQSRPGGAAVMIDGKQSGNTPLTVRLPSGAHVLEVKMGNSEPRVIPLMIRAGAQTAQYVELHQPQPISTPPPPAEKTRKR
jgi:hypothetical protein